MIDVFDSRENGTTAYVIPARYMVGEESPLSHFSPNSLSSMST